MERQPDQPGELTSADMAGSEYTADNSMVVVGEGSAVVTPDAATL
jgi:hypothetical protein